MDLQEYISSGIIETCVLGLASPEELRAFENLCAVHPEIQAARDSFEQLLEKRALEQAVAPPTDLKAKIWDAVNEDTAPVTERPVVPAPVIGWRRIHYVAAASLVLLVGSTLLNLYFFNQYKHYSEGYAKLLASQTELANANQTLQTKLAQDSSSLDLIRDPHMAVVKMAGLPSSPSSLATVFWDTQSKDVYLLVNNLPIPASTDRQYQLWALVDGKPVDAGVFDIQTGLVKMKNIPKAQAFAITLEKRGGSLSPTMAAMFVLGKVTG